MTFWEKLKDLLKDDPIYAPAKCDPYAEGWKFAYDQQTAKLKIAEKRLKSLDELADAMLKYGWGTQYARDIKTIVHMTEEELNADYGD
jgi:hypothetical protein